MLVVGLIFIFLAIKYDYEPLLLIPIGVGVIIGNIPFFQDGDVNLQLGIYQEGSVLNFFIFRSSKRDLSSVNISWDWSNDRFFLTHIKSQINVTGRCCTSWYIFNFHRCYLPRF